MVFDQTEQERGEMNGLRQKMTRFMYGRYGNDQLSRMLLGLALVCLVLELFIRNPLLYLAGVGLMGYSMYRTLSRNTSKMAA